MSNMTGNTESGSEVGLDVLAERETTRELDDAFAAWTINNFYPSVSADDRKLIECLSKAVSYALHLKHTCLDLNNYARLGDQVLDELLEAIDATTVRGLNISTVNGDLADAGPLLCSVDGHMLWLQKYHVFEQAVTKKIANMNAGLDEENTLSVLSEAQIKDLDDLYGASNADQRNAVETTLTHRFSIITGGPGTGKTYTVARIITLMLRHGAGGRRHPRIALAAPTGKAANRMQQSLEDAFSVAEIQAMIEGYRLPDKATTLHSLLGIYRNSPKSRYDASNPLPIDVLIVDEASMVALPMIYRILEALPESARLILLGDKDQLSSVEAGSVLGELCDMGKPHVATIKRSYRYEDRPEIGALAQAINSDRPTLPNFETNAYVIRKEIAKGSNSWAPGWLADATKQLKKLTANLNNGDKVVEILKRQTGFQLLCALRKGPAGVMGINSMLETSLKKKSAGWYTGRPIMILANDHHRKLYNGDVGLVLPVSADADDWVIDNDKGVLRACFPVGTQEVKTISLAQMPVFETCYAMTVHKSQGSEYKKVLLVLPEDRDEAEKNPVITKELVYTGVTRASQEIEIWCGAGVLETAINKKTVRMTGLGRR